MLVHQKRDLGFTILNLGRIPGACSPKGGPRVYYFEFRENSRCLFTKCKFGNGLVFPQICKYASTRKGCRERIIGIQCRALGWMVVDMQSNLETWEKEIQAHD